MSRLKTSALTLLALSAAPRAQELPDSMNLLESNPRPARSLGPASPSQSAPRAPAQPSSAKSTPGGSSMTQMDRANSEPALRVGIKYIQHQKMTETSLRSAPASPPPSLTVPPPSGSSSASEEIDTTPSGEIIVSQAVFEGYISFLSFGRQYGALQFGIPVRQIRSSHSSRASGSEFGGMDLMLTAGERGVGSFGVGAKHMQSSTLSIVEKHQRLKGFFYLERGSLASVKKGSRFHVQIGPELSMPLKNGNTEKKGFRYSPMYGGKAQIGMVSNLGFDNLVRLRGFGHYYRVNGVEHDGKKLEGGGLMSTGGGLDYNVAGDIWIGLEVVAALTKPKDREYVFGDPELPGLYGNSLGVSIQAAAF